MDPKTCLEVAWSDKSPTESTRMSPLQIFRESTSASMKATMKSYILVFIAFFIFLVARIIFLDLSSW